MRRYLSILACSALLGIGTLSGTSAFAGVIHLPEIAPTAGTSRGSLDTAVLVKKSSEGAASGLQFIRGGFGGGFHGMGGGMGGFHGMGGPGFHGGFRGFGGPGFRGPGFGFHGGHGMGHFHGGHFIGHGRFHDGDDFGGGWWGIGIPIPVPVPGYAYCDPYSYDYYGACYPGYDYYPGY